MRKLHLLIFACSTLAFVSPSPADVPDRVVTEFPGSGGDSVTGDEDWFFIADADSCSLAAYRFDYATMSWLFDQTVPPPVSATSAPNFCPFSEFGTVSSSDEEVLVVGAPGLQPNGGNACNDATPNNRGGFAVYELENGTWTIQPIGNACGPGDNLLFTPDATSNNDRIAEKVTVSKVGAGSVYLIGIGSPGYDRPGFAGDNQGRIGYYRYDASNNSLTSIFNVVTGTPESQLGSAISLNQGGSDSYSIVGGAGFADPEGRAYVIEVTDSNSFRIVNVLAPNGGDTGLGQDLSLSSRYAVASSDGNAYVWGNAGSVALPDYTDGPAVISTGGGDVSQSNGIVAAAEGGGAFDGAQIVRAPLIDDLNADQIVAELASTSGNLADISEDIRLVRESLWFANPSEDRALLMRFPAGYGIRFDTAFAYQQISLPCNVVGKTVSEVYGSLGSSAGSGGSDFDIYLYDDNAAVTSGAPYEQLNDSYTFTSDDANYSLWFAVGAGKEGYVTAEDCVGFSVPDTVYNGPTDGLPANIRGHRSIPLPQPAFDSKTGKTFARVMVNNPFPRAVRVADLRYDAGGGVVKTLAQAEAANELSAVIYIYDPANGSATSQGYRPVTAAGTPPFNDTIAAQEGFWVEVLDNGSANQALRVTVAE